jgi:hypothetical protein
MAPWLTTPTPIAVVQSHDQGSDCAMITAEIQANNTKVSELANEKGMKVVQNVAAGVVGIVVWPMFFAMDSKGAASTEMTALQARQEISRETCRATLRSAYSLMRAMIRLEQRGGVAIAFMAAALWIMLLIAAWEYLF